MPISFDIRRDLSLAIATHEGVVPDEEFLTAYRSLYGSSRFDKSFNLLVDLTRADSSTRSTETLKGFADFIRGQYAGTDVSPKVAVVAPENISFGLARMYESFADTVRWEFRVFREIPDALFWMGLEEELPGLPE